MCLFVYCSAGEHSDKDISIRDLNLGGEKQAERRYGPGVHERKVLVTSLSGQ